MTATVMPAINTCTVNACSYNHDGCHAFAITISRDTSCATFIPLTVKGGLNTATAQVGACQRADCRHNDSLACSADSVLVGADADKADCLTYSQR